MKNEAFDFVIVGAGSAGCVLASRLSEDPGTRVCLIEAGPSDRSWLIRTPAAVVALMNHKRFGWGYSTTEQRYLDGRRVNLPRGRVLGGCGSTNGMVYFRGHPADFDGWAAAGNAGWSYREVLPYFVRSECNETWARSPFHGADGPMHVSDVKRLNPLVPRFIEAAISLGYGTCEDFNGPDPEGFGARQATIRKGRRESTATAYLHPAERRANLKVLTGVLVDKILLQWGRAVAVQVDHGGRVAQIAARREIIVCGGTFGTPAILLRSGIGDDLALRRLGIAVHQVLPGVGRNLQEHLVAPVQITTSSTESYGLSARAAPRAAWSLVQYALRKQGPLASNVFEATGFLRTSPHVDRPDIQLIFMPVRRNPSGFPIPIGHGYGVLAVLLRPRSRGTVTIDSRDPGAPPIIDPNFLGEPADLEVLLEGLKIARRLVHSPAFEGLGAVEVVPGSSARDDAALVKHIRATAATVHHPAGTCRMGVDEECVVDPQLRVRGVAGLRVSDASVFPSLISGNINAAVVMIAERAADLILGRRPPEPIDPDNIGLSSR